MARKKRTITDEHKAAIATGRTEVVAVGHYLDALQASKSRRRNPERIEAQINDIDETIDSMTSVKALLAIQRRLELVAALEEAQQVVDITPLEDAFVGIANAFSERKGVSYTAWRQAGVPAAVLRRAGIAVTRS